MIDLAKNRAAIRALQAERQVVADAPRARAEVEAELLQWCEAQTAAGDAQIGWQVRALAQDDCRFNFLKLQAPAGGSIDLAPLLASLIGPAALSVALCRHLDPLGEGVTSEDRSKRLAEIDADLFNLEREEEQHIVSEEARGALIQRRGDADPRAVLWIDPPSRVGRKK